MRFLGFLLMMLTASSAAAQTQGPDPDYRPILRLAATDREAANSMILGQINDRIEAGEPAEAVLAELSRAALDAQGLAFEYGRGRVVVLGEAGMLTAQRLAFPAGDEREVIVFGLQTSGHDDQQFALNVLHWLSRLI